MKIILKKKSGKKPRLETHGFMLMEILVSVLLFALGIVALVGIQARSLMATDDAQYRAEAIHLANAYMAQMWAAGVTGAAIQENFQTGGTQWSVLHDQVTGQNGYPGIPGGQVPAVVVSDFSVADSSISSSADVTITISWLDRDEVRVHNYAQTSAVGY